MSSVREVLAVSGVPPPSFGAVLGATQSELSTTDFLGDLIRFEDAQVGDGIGEPKHMYKVRSPEHPVLRAAHACACTTSQSSATRVRPGVPRLWL